MGSFTKYLKKNWLGLSMLAALIFIGWQLMEANDNLQSIDMNIINGLNSVEAQIQSE